MHKTSKERDVAGSSGKFDVRRDTPPTHTSSRVQSNQHQLSRHIIRWVTREKMREMKDMDTKSIWETRQNIDRYISIYVDLKQELLKSQNVKYYEYQQQFKHGP
jgi:hypothetical protein